MGATPVALPGFGKSLPSSWLYVGHLKLIMKQAVIAMCRTVTLEMLHGEVPVLSPHGISGFAVQYFCTHWSSNVT